MAHIVGGVLDMKQFVLIVLVILTGFSTVPVGITESQYYYEIKAFAVQPNFNGTSTPNDTMTSVSTIVITTTTATTSVLIQTFTIPTTTYQTTSLRQLNTTVNVAVTVLSSIIIAIPSLTTVTRTSTVSSNTTSINTIVVPHYQSEYFTSDVLIIVDVLIALAFSIILVAMLIRWKRR
jgi:hypothetical protein